MHPAAVSHSLTHASFKFQPMERKKKTLKFLCKYAAWDEKPSYKQTENHDDHHQMLIDSFQ